MRLLFSKGGWARSLRVTGFFLAFILTAADLPQFRGLTISADLKTGYQIVVVDLNRDGKPDLIVVDERANELSWYENLSWERHVRRDAAEKS